MSELQMVKSIIRGCLVSNPEQQLQLSRLNEDYRNQEGQYIPYQKLGFPTIWDFMLSIPDTVSISKTDRSMMTIVRPVTSEKTAHVQSLVKRQSSNSSKRVRRKFPSSAFNRRPNHTFSNCRTTSLCTQRRPLASLSSSRVSMTFTQTQPSQATRPFLTSMREPEEIFVPAWLEQEIICFVQKQPGMSLRILEEKINANGRIEVKKVYSSMEDVIRSMSQKLRIDHGEVFPRGSLSPAKPVRLIAGGEEDRMFDTEYLEDLMQDLHYGDGDDQGNNGVNKTWTNSSKRTHTVVAERQCAGVPKVFNGLDSCDESDGSEGDFLPLKDNEGECYPSNMSEKMKARISQLLDDAPKGIWCATLADQYQNAYKQELNFLNIGYVSVVQMLQTSPELFYCKQIDNCDWKLFDARKKYPAPVVPEITIQRIEELLLKNNDGLNIDNFPLAYERMFGTAFDYQEMNYSSLVELLSDLSGIVHMSPVDNSFLLFSVNSSVGQNIQAATPEEIDPMVRSLFPDDVVDFEYEFPRLKLPKTVCQGADIEVIVAALVHINHFYVQLRSMEYSRLVDVVEVEMRVFYQQEAGRYRLPSKAVMAGLYCVASVNGEYNRLRIVRVCDNDNVKVLHIDYGNITIVKKKALHFMHKDFAHTPGQAIRCRCTNLKPPNGAQKFTHEGGWRLLELVKDKGIVASVSQVFPERLWMWVSLVDTTSDVDVHINDQLIEEGYATFHRDRIEPAGEYLKHLSDEEFRKAVEEQNCIVATSEDKSVSLSESRSVAGSVARSVDGSDRGSPLLSRGRRTSPVVPSIDELQARLMVAPGPLRPPPGFQPLTNTKRKVDVTSILKEQAFTSKDTSPGYKNDTSVSQSEPLASPVRELQPENSTMNVKSPEFIPRHRQAIVTKVEVEQPAPSMIVASQREVKSPNRELDEMKRLAVAPQDSVSLAVPSVEIPIPAVTKVTSSGSLTGVPLQKNTSIPIPSHMYSPHTRPHLQQSLQIVNNRPLFIRPQQNSYYIPQPPVQTQQVFPNCSNTYQPPFPMQTGQAYNPYPYQFTPQNVYLPPRMPYPRMPYFLPTNPQPHAFLPPQLMYQQQAFELNQALTRLWENSRVEPSPSAPNTPRQPETISQTVQTEEKSYDGEITSENVQTISQKGVEDSRVEFDNLTDEAKEEMLSPDSNTSLESQDVTKKNVDEVAEDCAEKSEHEVDLMYDCEDDLPTISGSESDGEKSPISYHGKYITKIDIGGQQLLLFNIDEKLYLDVREVIGLSDLKITVALKILKSKEVNRKFHDLKKKTHGHIFDELTLINLNSGLKSLDVLSVQLVPFENVMELLSAVNIKDQYLSKIEAQMNHAIKLTKQGV